MNTFLKYFRKIVQTNLGEKQKHTLKTCETRKKTSYLFLNKLLVNSFFYFEIISSRFENID